jgi:hypothetical protein
VGHIGSDPTIVFEEPLPPDFEEGEPTEAAPTSPSWMAAALAGVGSAMQRGAVSPFGDPPLARN